MAKAKTVNSRTTRTVLEEAFVDAFTGECEFDPIKSFLAAGYESGSKNVYSSAMVVLGRDVVKKAIHARMHDSTFWLNEAAVISRLWKEGISANTASARVNALVWVGKNIGMWQEREEGTDVVYNIVNYGTPVEKMVEAIEAKPEIEASKDRVELPEGVSVLSYSDKTH
jgi:hypothetical protein